MECIHRGAKRHTCCGTPDLWICRRHKSDCVATEYDRRKLLVMLNSDDKTLVLACDVCTEFATEVQIGPRTYHGNRNQ